MRCPCDFGVECICPQNVLYNIPRHGAVPAQGKHPSWVGKLVRRAVKQAVPLFPLH